MRMLLAVIALVPLPLASNRPFFWGLTACVMGIILLLWVISNLIKVRHPAVPLSQMGVQVVLFCVFMLFLIVQILPIGPMLGGLASAGLEGLDLVPRTISLAPGETILMLLRQLTYAVFYFLMVQVGASDSQRGRVLDVMLVIITIYALIGLMSLRMGDTILGFQKWAYLGSATGTFVNRNSFATFLAFGAVLALTQLIDIVRYWVEQGEDREPFRRVMPAWLLYGAALLLILAAIVSTQSRMGFVASVAGALTVIGLAIGVSLRFARWAIILLLLGTFAVVGMLIFYGDGLLDRVGSLERSLEVRLGLYEQVLQLIAQRPLTGFGGGAFAHAFPLVHELPVSGDALWDKAHNTYLSLWVELGLVAGSIPLVLIAIMAVRLLTSLFKSRRAWRSKTVALGVIVVGAVHSIFDFSLEIQANTIVFLALIALGFAAAVKLERTKS
ncbi:O-antigen ligase family protein [Devosia faecipullorum]|uniref:O-antigen ligase family protein n=1 Tax=Devosia faecipullorum TaxID=2755039 RepID=UPI00187BB734|nr:O-antigen ligase family protein [Devosia faecipullorum]MBE7731957.1 O-antigen ligase family protein [Devosia faecipullorum]